MATLKDIAESLHVSVSTVSRALNGSSSISEQVRAQVCGAAESLGYTLKGRGGRRTPEWNMAGLIVPEVRSEYYSRIVHLSQERFLRNGYATMIQVTDFNCRSMYAAIGAMKRIQARCLLIVLDDEETIPENTMDAIHKSGLPVMLVTSRYFTMLDVDCIHTNEVSGIAMGIRHLIERGYRKIGFIGETMTENRHSIFNQVMREHVEGWRPELVAVGRERGALGGYLRMQELLGLPERPDAVFASYDQMAIGAIHAIREAGLRIPGEIAVLGFDDISEAAYVEGGITTIASPCEDMISIAVNILMKRIHSPGGTPQQIALRPRLVIRKTT